MRTDTYFISNGKLCIYKTPTAELLYGLDLVDWLATTGTQLSSVSAAVQGVTLVGDPFIDGTKVCAWINGFDQTDGAINTCTFAFAGTDGKSSDTRTIHFLQRPS